MDAFEITLTSLTTAFAGIAAWPIAKEWALPLRLTDLQKAMICFAARNQNNCVWFTSNFKGSGAPVVLPFIGAFPVNDPLAETEALLAIELLEVTGENEQIPFAEGESSYLEMSIQFQKLGITPRGRALAAKSLCRFPHLDFYEKAGGKVSR